MADVFLSLFPPTADACPRRMPAHGGCPPTADVFVLAVPAHGGCPPTADVSLLAAHRGRWPALCSCNCGRTSAHTRAAEGAGPRFTCTTVVAPQRAPNTPRALARVVLVQLWSHLGAHPCRRGRWPAFRLHNSGRSSARAQHAKGAGPRCARAAVVAPRRTPVPPRALARVALAQLWSLLSVHLTLELRRLSCAPTELRRMLSTAPTVLRRLSCAEFDRAAPTELRRPSCAECYRAAPTELRRM